MPTIETRAAPLEVRKEFGTFSEYVWSFAGRGAEALSKDLKRRGFRFVGPTTVYAFMQAVGMVKTTTRNPASDATIRRMRRKIAE